MVSLLWNVHTPQVPIMCLMNIAIMCFLFHGMNIILQ